MKIQFLRDTSKAVISNIPKETLLIYRDGFGYEIPEIKGVEYIEFLDFKMKYTTYQPELIIIIGLNRIITPSNRCDMVNEYLQTMTQNIPKICIDKTPFIGEPWRLWFHYSIANCGNFGIAYSYIIETEWQKWFYREAKECKLSANNIKDYISDTYSDIQKLTTQFEFYQPETTDNEWYKQAKESVFEIYNTPKLLINNLLKLSNKHFDIKLSYDSYRDNKIFELPDLKIYRFMVEENQRRMDIYNEIIS